MPWISKKDSFHNRHCVCVSEGFFICSERKEKKMFYVFFIKTNCGKEKGKHFLYLIKGSRIKSILYAQHCKHDLSLRCQEEDDPFYDFLRNSAHIPLCVKDGYSKSTQDIYDDRAVTEKKENENYLLSLLFQHILER